MNNRKEKNRFADPVGVVCYALKLADLIIAGKSTVRCLHAALAP